MAFEQWCAFLFECIDHVINLIMLSSELFDLRWCHVESWSIGSGVPLDGFANTILLVLGQAKLEVML